MKVELARPLCRTDQLDAARAVDEVEENELPHVAARHDPAGQPALGRVVACTRLELLGFGPDGRNLVPVWETLRSGHGRRV